MKDETNPQTRMEKVRKLLMTDYDLKNGIYLGVPIANEIVGWWEKMYEDCCIMREALGKIKSETEPYQCNEREEKCRVISTQALSQVSDYQSL